MRGKTIIKWECLLHSIATDCGCDPYTIRYLINRLRNEGVRFLTVTLPKLSKSVLRSLELGMFERPTDFAWKGRSLRYFRSLLDGIFCRKTGKLIDVDVVCLNYVRQLGEYCYKLGLAFTDEQLSEASHTYIATQVSVGQLVFDDAWVETLRKNAENYYKPLFNCTVDSIHAAARPRGGPGSFSGSGNVFRKTGFKYHLWKQLPDGSTGTCNSKQVPFSGFYKPYPSSPTKITIRNEPQISEVCFVKKDSRGPRVISKEPYHQLRSQLGFFDWITPVLEKVSGNTINFVDQSINRRLARVGSLDRSVSTLDLKEASDRVSYKLARRIFMYSPGISYYLTKLRSKHYKLGSHEGVVNSIAGMGSGLTFPLLAFIVQLSVCSEISIRLGLKYNKVRERVYVYGDDLIVPTAWYNYATRALEKSGLVVNNSKSYWRSHFRESCGGDYYKGNECSPIRLKLSFCDLPKPQDCKEGLEFTSKDADIIIGLCKHTHQLRKAGLNNTSTYIERALSHVVPMPYVGDGSPVIGRYTWDNSLVYKQAKPGDASSPDGYIYAAVPKACNSSLKEQCPYKFLSSKISKEVEGDSFLIQLSKGFDSGASPFGVVPNPRQLRLKFGKQPVLRATRVASTLL